MTWNRWFLIRLAVIPVIGLILILMAASLPAAAGTAAAALSTTGVRQLRFGVTTPGGPLASAELAEVVRLAGERPSIEMWYEDFVQPVPLAELNAVESRGAMPVITWEPWQWGGGVNQPKYALDRITAGDHDSHIREWAVGLRSWGHPVTLRFAHEMNGSWYPWAEGVNGNGAGDYVAAWRHVHNIMTSVGATNVSWMFSPNTPYSGSVPLSKLYPGAGYVDAVALDGYNWGTTQPWSAWTSAQVLLGQGLSQLRALAPGKSIVIGETAAAEAGGSKPVWIRGLLAYLSAQKDVRGFIWFQHRKETDWRFTSSAASATAFSTALANRR